MSDAVNELLVALEGMGIEPELNALYGPGAAELPVPELHLRNVTGSDALRLIGMSANCEAEPIVGHLNAEIIGYRITQKETPRIDPAAMRPGSGRGLPSPLSRPPSAGLAPVVPAPTSAGGKPGQAANPSFGIPGFGPQGLPGQMPLPGFVVGSKDASPAVRVYPLGGITSVVKFPDIEATLRDVLKAGSVPADDAKFALHEKTNVLVVTASERVQGLVEEFLEALRKNQADIESSRNLQDEAMRESIGLRTQIEAEQRQRKVLEEEVAQSRAMLRKLVQELSGLKNTTSKPPQ